MAFIPLNRTVEVGIPGEPVVDRFGNERPGKPDWRTVKVAAWWIAQTQESHGDSVLRTIDVLSVCATQGAGITPDSKIRLQDGSVWAVDGNGENYDHGPFQFQPGLLVYTAKQVEG